MSQSISDYRKEDPERDADGPPAVQSVDRALTIMEILSERGWSSVGEVAERLDIHKSTASRLLNTLAQRGFVEQEAARGRYRLGFGLVHLASAVTADLDLARLARPVCEQLSQQTQETVNIAVLDRDEVVNIDQVIGSSSVVSVNWLGRRNPLHCASTGKVLLAFLPDALQARLLRPPLERLTEHTITDLTQLKRHLGEVRRVGYAVTREELDLGMNAVAAPVRTHDERVVAALSVAGPSYRMAQARLPELGELTQQAARQLSAQLGFQARGSAYE